MLARFDEIVEWLRNTESLLALLPRVVADNFHHKGLPCLSRRIHGRKTHRDGVEHEHEVGPAGLRPAAAEPRRREPVIPLRVSSRTSPGRRSRADREVWR